MAKTKYILATREMMLWHYNGYILPYFKSKYSLEDFVHSSANMDKKSNSVGSFLFSDVTDELEEELKSFGFDIAYREKRIRLSWY